MTSMMTWVDAPWTYSDTLPCAPSGAMVKFGAVVPATKFWSDASGTALPVGNTVRKPVPSASVTVTFRATATAPTGVAGVPWPTTPTDSVSPA